MRPKYNAAIRCCRGNHGSMSMPEHPDYCHYECQGKGWCPIYQLDMRARWVRLCATNLKYRTAWREGRGPGQIRKPDERSAVGQAQQTARAARHDERARQALEQSIDSAFDLGKATVSREEAERRMKTCLACPYCNRLLCLQLSAPCAVRYELWIMRIVAGECKGFGL